MYIDKAVINYEGFPNRLEVVADEEHLLVRRYDSSKLSSEISFGIEELLEVVSIAKFLRWEGFE